MKDFLGYFFGVGAQPEFQNFTIAHFAPIIFMVVCILLIYRLQNKLRESRFEVTLRYVMAFVMIISEMSYYWRLVGKPSLGPNPVDHLPITVCGWAVIFCSYMVIGKSQTLFDISYFWLFSGSIFALITPTVITYTGITRFRYYQFWTEHIIGYIGIFYMIFVHKLRPTIKSAIKSYLCLGVLAVIAYIANQLIGPGANYLFMARPEDTPSVLDILPSNFAVRILIMAGVVTLLFFVAYLPWLLIDIKLKKKENAQVKEQETEKIETVGVSKI
ncbi:MAG: TIGR02206 family membrane protein [Clostridia bacterium]|nr:TIGR02206 family membrane protein [Clostridia bacterium]